MLKRNEYFLVSILTPIVFTMLFVARAMDDNRLTSWQWVFNGVNASAIFLVLLAGSILMVLLSRISCSVRRPGTFLFLSSFVAAVPFWTEPEIIVDASRYFTQAKYLEVYGIGHFVREWGRDIAAWTDLPLVPFLYGLIFSVLGESRLYIQVFTTCLFSATVVITYLIGKDLWNRDIGFYGGILLLGFPYLLIQVPLMLVDVPTMFFLTLGVLAFIKALGGKGPGSILVGGLCIFLAFLSKYSTWPMLSVLGIIFLVCRNRNPELTTRNYMLRGLLTLLTALLLIGIVVYVKFDAISDQMALLMSYQKPGLKRWGEGFVSTFFFQTHPFITISALISVWIAFKKRDLMYLVVLWLPVLMVAFQIKRIRYILPMFPMVALMASYGLQQLRDERVRRLAVLCVLLSSLVIGCFVYLPFARKMSVVNLKDAGAFLDSIGQRDAEVFAPLPKEPALNPAVAVPLLDLYTKKRIIYHYEPSFAAVPEGVNESALRFTWEYRNPEYYGEPHEIAGKKAALVVVTSEPGEALPGHVERRIEGYRSVREFNTDEGIFQYRTFVTVYLWQGEANSERPEVR